MSPPLLRSTLKPSSAIPLRLYWTQLRSKASYTIANVPGWQTANLASQRTSRHSSL
ncbi:MAG TPA: hypothetical protein V6D34_17000 [Candidatus Sericytochromatia bacterium]